MDPPVSPPPSDPRDPRHRSGRSRRAPPVIDLKATEVRAAQANPAAKGPAEAASPEPAPKTAAGAGPMGPATTPEVKPAGSAEARPDQTAGTPPHGDALAGGGPGSAVHQEATPATASGAASAPRSGPRRSKVWPAPTTEPATAGGAGTPAPDRGEAQRPPAEAPKPSPERPAAAEASPPSRSPSDAAEPRRSGTGAGALFAAGLIGGLLGAGGALLGSTYLRPAGHERLAEIEQRSAPRDTVTALERRLATVEQGQAGIAEQARAARAAAEAAASRPAAGAAPGGPAPDAPAGQAAPALDPAALARLDQRLQAVEAAAKANADAAAALQRELPEQGARLTAAADSLGSRLSALDGVVPRLNALETEMKAQVGARSETTAAYDRRFAAQDQRIATQDQRLAAQDQRLGELARQVQETGPEAVRAGLRVVLSDHLVAVLREGSGYADTLAALKRLNVEAAALAPLEPFAAGGAPTLAALQREFKPLADRMVAASRPAGAQGEGLSDRLWRMADQIVTVRTVGDPNAEDLPGRIARIEAALGRGAAGEAASAWDALPEQARRASEEWARRLKARAAAEAAARQISARALAALEAPAR